MTASRRLIATAGRRQRWARCAALAALVTAVSAALAAGGLPPQAPAAETRCTEAALPLTLQPGHWQRQRLAAGDAAMRAAATLAEARALLRLQRGDQAQPLLLDLLSSNADTGLRAEAALALGSWRWEQRREAEAVAAWQQAAQLAGADTARALAAELNLLRAAPSGALPLRQRRLAAAVAVLPQLPDRAERVRLAGQALGVSRLLDPADAAARLALARSARDWAGEAGDDTLHAQALDLLAGELEAAGDDTQALQVSLQGLWVAQRSGRRELLFPLEHRVGRLSARQGRHDLALAALRRAVGHVEAVRADIPVRYEDGRSSFRDTLEPVYLALAGELLRAARAAQGDERQRLLRQTRDTVELIKQTELEDYLRDRCSLSAARQALDRPVPAGVAVLHPVILPDRLDVLVETAAGWDLASAPVDAARLRRTAEQFVAALRDRRALRPLAQALYRWLLAPVEPLLASRGVHTLVQVPDGVLRLVPLAALHDGQDWVVQRYATATLPGLSLLAPAQPARPLRLLLAGVADPGPAVDRLPPGLLNAIARPDAVRGGAASARAALALPGVTDEVRRLSATLPGTTMLDRGFTLQAFRDALLASDHPIVHIASHGLFGESGQSTFVMAWDELLTLDELQRLLQTDRLRRQPIELLTLSACETAEGDDRAPLGMSGAAIRARARSALGTLWPVSDTAARDLMTHFYRLLARGDLGKAQALRLAQLDLMAQPTTQHPFFWAPFNLVGDWR